MAHHLMSGRGRVCRVSTRDKQNTLKVRGRLVAVSQLKVCRMHGFKAPARAQLMVSDAQSCISIDAAHTEIEPQTDNLWTESALETESVVAKVGEIQPPSLCHACYALDCASLTCCSSLRLCLSHCLA